VNTKYSGTQWHDALDDATTHEFCEIDSRERAGELAGVVAEMYTEDEIRGDEGKFYAAITVAAGLAEEFDREFLTRVLLGNTQELEDSMEKRAIKYIEEKWPGFPVREVRYLSGFAMRHALKDHERSAYDGGSVLMYVFDVSELLS